MVGIAGCSVSESSLSLSNSSESTSHTLESMSDSSVSSSASSQPKTDQAYREDVRDYTAAYVMSGGQFDAFQRTLGQLAQKHQITDWEDNRTTFVGIGEGLARANVKGIALDTFKRNLAGSDRRKIDALEAGYGRAR